MPSLEGQFTRAVPSEKVQFGTSPILSLLISPSLRSESTRHFLSSSKGSVLPRPSKNPHSCEDPLLACKLAPEGDVGTEPQSGSV
jgi:hypothetical protein